ncbi:MAG: hypothetical protein JWP64_5934 [Pseudonocardia sp.]|jgi:hypothetical protein|nr:hypothetical protein [Pseudonocardia sp.]MDT7700022.1 hypothetical protein [Pseudonocardiales bacterium]
MLSNADTKDLIRRSSWDISRLASSAVRVLYTRRPRC